MNGRHHLTILQRSLFPPIIELVIQQALNRVVHCSDKDNIYSKLISLNWKSSVHGGGAMSGSGLGWAVNRYLELAAVAMSVGSSVSYIHL